jgi:hypothetical protein
MLSYNNNNISNIYQVLFLFLYFWTRKKEQLNLKTDSFCLSKRNYIVLFTGPLGPC